MKYLTVELSIFLILLSTSIFTFVNAFTNWVPDIYAVLSVVLALFVDLIWRRYYDNQA